MDTSAEAASMLISSLHALSKSKPKLVRSSTYHAPADPAITIRSWKMNEFKYYDIPSPFPTLARGLFSRWVGENAWDLREGQDSGKHIIVARGYDKFFNIGEVPWTTWAALEKYTTSPYTLTLKSNGCIIFIAALNQSKLVITSKHSLGPLDGIPVSHSQMGERWLMRHLENKGKTAEDLAAILWQKNWTAVAELCDDSFEEHVLAYPDHLTGLHLHGINENIGAFNTQPPEVIHSFAEEWGFIPTPTITLHTVDEVKEFTEKVGETGKWNGDAVEGFVVRTTLSEAAAPSTPRQRDAPPYPPGSSFFFKVKFDEPYMMYRDWRELTRSLLTAQAKGDLKSARLPRGKLFRPETRVYKEWVEKEMVENKDAFKDYGKGKGIIAVREKFVKWLETPDGQAQLAKAKGTTVPAVARPMRTERRAEKVVLVPIAVPGCGKTALGVALSHLFGFGHIQNDDIKEKKAAPVFTRKIIELLRRHDVVYADRNNHLQSQRQNIREQVSTAFDLPVRLIALNWSLSSLPLATVHRITSDRILGRGGNHQTLRPNDQGKHEEVIWMFINARQELGEEEVDEVIEMEIEENIEESLARGVNGIVEHLGLEKPSTEKIGEALRIALDYRTEARQGTDLPLKKDQKPRYFGFLPEVDLESVVGQVLATDDTPKSGLEFWSNLGDKKRITGRAHVTITHIKGLPHEQSIWDSCSKVTQSTSPPTFLLKLGHLVWNDRVMAITIDNISLVEEDEGEEAGKKWLDELPDNLRRRLHITVGTQAADIQPYEAKTLVETWRKKGDGEVVESKEIRDVVVKARLKGLLS